MPWWSASSAPSLSIAGGLEVEANAGATELTLRCQDEAKAYVSGVGYFNERLYENQTGGYAPFFASGAAWISSISAMRAQGSTWDSTVSVCVNLLKRWRSLCPTYQGVTTSNGARVAGQYDPRTHRCTVETTRDALRRIRIPARIEGEPLRVVCNGKPVENITVEADQCVRFLVSSKLPRRAGATGRKRSRLMLRCALRAGLLAWVRASPLQ